MELFIILKLGMLLIGTLWYFAYKAYAKKN